MIDIEREVQRIKEDILDQVVRIAMMRECEGMEGKNNNRYMSQNIR